MKKLVILMATMVLAAGVLQAAEKAHQDQDAKKTAPVLDAAIEKAARAEVAKITAIEDNEKAAEQLAADLKAMYEDNDGKAAKDGLPELVLALLAKIDFERAKMIIPRVLTKLTGSMNVGSFQRLVASVLVASEGKAAQMTTAILNALEGKSRWIEAVAVVAADTPRPLPIALLQAIRSISATVLPPAVIPPGSYEGQ